MANNFGSDGSMYSRAPLIQIPKMVMPSTYYKPSPIVHKATINLAPSTSKALSQQVPPSNIKSYLSIKKTTIDLTSDIRFSNTVANTPQNRDQKVRFSMTQSQSMAGGMDNLAQTPQRISH